MYPISEDLEVKKNNPQPSYLPIRNKNNDIDWQVVTGLVLSYSLKHKIEESYDIEQFRIDCKAHFQKIIDEPSFWNVLEKMYFLNRDIFRVSPMFLFFQSRLSHEKLKSVSAANKRLGTLFANLMEDISLDYPIPDKLNFIERQLLNKLDEKIDEFSDESPFIKEQSYLPFIAKCFQADLAFLAQYPHYLLQELANTLRLYAFSWCAQLALNLDNWKKGEPQSKSLFFILDTEKASAERECVQTYGYKLFARHSKNLFPMLSALEALQWNDKKQKGQPKRPLWQVYQDCINYSDKRQVINSLNNYLKDFIEDRELPSCERAESLDDAFKQLMSVSVGQFLKKKSDRARVNRDYVNELENQIGADFIQVRGRAGKVLVLNQDRLLLLTNLTVGTNDKLRLHELLRGFEQRGFYLDNQSVQTLVAFYERMGNVERMSDSGDAVYVRKTV